MTTTYITKKLNVKGIGYTVLEASGKINYISVSKDMPNSRRGTLGKEFTSYNEAYSYYKCPFLKAELLKAELNLILPSEGGDVSETPSETGNVELTINQVKELHILVVGLKKELLSGVEGTARVAKTITSLLESSFLDYGNYSPENNKEVLLNIVRDQITRYSAKIAELEVVLGMFKKAKKNSPVD